MLASKGSRFGLTNAKTVILIVVHMMIIYCQVGSLMWEMIQSYLFSLSTRMGGEENGPVLVTAGATRNTPPLTTTNRILEERKKKISLHSLPLSFLDAINITRRLGLRFLWIDSLCIIQDSREDWLKESSDMGRVYQEAFLTIAAEKAIDSTQGIFNSIDSTRGHVWNSSRRESLLAANVRIGYHSTDLDISGSLTIRLPPRDLNGSAKSHLSTRAWTLQETTLSPRVVRCRQEQLFWSCCQGTFSEMIPDYPTPIEVARDHKIMIRLQEPDLDVRTILRWWYSILQDYATRELSIESDKLVAISGLARLVSEKTGYTYKSGLWLEDIHSGLAWNRPHAPTTRRLKNYTAPSWSWASIFAGQLYAVIPKEMADPNLRLSPMQPKNNKAEIVKVDVCSLGGDPFGQISHASLVIRGAC
jgi:hypothetical protein